MRSLHAYLHTHENAYTKRIDKIRWIQTVTKKGKDVIKFEEIHKYSGTLGRTFYVHFYSLFFPNSEEFINLPFRLYLRRW